MHQMRLNFFPRARVPEIPTQGAAVTVPHEDETPKDPAVMETADEIIDAQEGEENEGC